MKLVELRQMKTSKDEQNPLNEALKTSEHLYRSIVEQSVEGIVLHDLQGQILMANPTFCKSIGYTERELAGMNITEVDPNVIIHEHIGLYWEVLSGDNKKGFESEHRRKDGTIFPVDVELSLIQINGGKYILGSARDITERKQAERQHLAHLSFLENLDRVNRDIQSASDIDQMMTDVLGSVLSVFDCDRAWLSYPCDPEAASWWVPMEQAKPEYPGAMSMELEITMQDDVARFLRVLLEKAGPVTFSPGSEYPLPEQTSKRFGYKSQICMALYPKLNKPWVFGLHQCSYPREWTSAERELFEAIGRRLEDALTSLLILRDLKQSEQQYRAAFEQSVDSVVLVNPETKQIEEFNDRACQSLGYTRKEFKKLDLSDVEAVESPEEIIRRMEKIEKDGVDLFETKHKTKTGEIRDVLVSVNVISVRGRKLFQAIFRDITDQKHAQDKLKEYQTKLKSMAVMSLLNEERQKRRIAHGLHDDIGQKLAITKIGLLSSIHSNTDEDTIKSVKRVCLEIDTMIENVRNLTFELSNPVLSELGLEAAIERHLKKEIQDKHNIAYQLDTCGRLNHLDEDICMCLFRSVRELLNNVIKHSKANKVSISLDKTDDEIVILVSDDGVGFDTVTVDSEINTGFGLFSIREQLESFSGKLKVESSVGHGSTFTISVPLNEESAT